MCPGVVQEIRFRVCKSNVFIRFAPRVVKTSALETHKPCTAHVWGIGQDRARLGRGQRLSESLLRWKIPWLCYVANNWCYVFTNRCYVVTHSCYVVTYRCYVVTYRCYVDTNRCYVVTHVATNRCQPPSCADNSVRVKGGRV